MFSALTVVKTIILEHFPARPSRELGLERMDGTSLFWTRAGRPVSRKGTTGQRGGDHGAIGISDPPRPDSENRLQKDFSEVWKLALAKIERARRHEPPSSVP
jgi:hypothetical protein